MEFSDMLSHYIQKHYSPVATRIVHILILLSIATSFSVFFLNFPQSENFDIVVIGEFILIGIIMLIIALGQQNNTVEKMERAIFLNSDFINKFDEKNKKIAFEKIDAVFSFNSKFKSKINYKGREKDCLKFLDPDNKSNWDNKKTTS
jgi:hypothetical protein